MYKFRNLIFDNRLQKSKIKVIYAIFKSIFMLIF